MKVIKPHIPLIKFRKGGRDQGISHKQTSVSQNSASCSQKGPVIDETELPARYSRKLLSQEEIETIEGEKKKILRLSRFISQQSFLLKRRSRIDLHIL
ncbi:28S ribosomal protein S36, mitochondrial-like isoform X2 [Stegodyphus dumicola]|uniref:28S ribosomal protein S36, mitochondrial-like isoform X2 n=1 Tax=Stegodyphus dumicola TaxID=202533 RepID=UPI0015AB2BF7|nr:28S ribosomal protein S36, mitochondrial-like isoform X2 [Stegodyphus dumicola]